jgi:hypothetical protein
MIDNAADDWRIAMTWQRMMQVYEHGFLRMRQKEGNLSPIAYMLGISQKQFAKND